MKISIITPSYQQDPYILRTLQSVAFQKVDAELEHIVMDGGSHDQTVSILKEAAQSMPHLKWLSEPDNGQAHAVNKGIQASSGDIIGWLNSDDIYYQGTLQRVLDFFNAHPDCDVVYGQADHINTNDLPFETYPTEPWDHERLIETCYFCQPAVFFRRRVFEKYGLLNDSLQYCMDYEYWLRLSKANASVMFLQKKLAGSRLYAETKTMHQKAKAHAEINDMLKEKFNSVPDKWLYHYAHAVIEQKMDGKQHPCLFRIMLTYHTLLSSIYWNRKLSVTLIKTIYDWLIKTPVTSRFMYLRRDA
ncbi:MAG: glycosyltransferase family 2 protein [Gammaproteobacteria bacterium]|nr:glycosyltransferase family 2 protein [Gammaproteobacteria bacterium]